MYVCELQHPLAGMARKTQRNISLHADKGSSIKAKGSLQEDIAV
jgi:hypothetical protein